MTDASVLRGLALGLSSGDRGGDPSNGTIGPFSVKLKRPGLTFLMSCGDGDLLVADRDAVLVCGFAGGVGRDFRPTNPLAFGDASTIPFEVNDDDAVWAVGTSSPSVGAGCGTERRLRCVATDAGLKVDVDASLGLTLATRFGGECPTRSSGSVPIFREADVVSRLVAKRPSLWPPFAVPLAIWGPRSPARGREVVGGMEPG